MPLCCFMQLCLVLVFIQEDTMKTIKFISNLTAFALTAALSLSTSFTAFADADGGFTKAEIEASEIKPTVTVSSIQLTTEEAAASPIQTVSIEVSGADMLYCSTGFHIYYDERLTIVPNSKGKLAVKGEAASDLNVGYNTRENCLFLTTTSSSDSGYDGVLWTFQVQLPSNFKNGDVYPIEIVYEKGEFTEDVFSNSAYNRTGKLMQAWVFTRGIQNGSISISDNFEQSDYLAGDVNCDGKIDMADVVLIMQSLGNPSRFGLNGSEPTHITAQGIKNGDVKGSDGLTNLDALSISKFLLKLIPSLPDTQ